MTDEDINRRLQHIEHELEELGDKITNIDKDLAKYRGMVGGVLLVVTAISAFFKFIWNDVRDRLQ